MNVLTTVLFLCLVVKINAHQKIVNGQTASDGKFPYQVALKDSGRYFCGASIINKRWILTAAHCLLKRSPKNITVHAGSNRIADKETQVFDVEYLTYHKGFAMRHLRNDIGLIRVARNIDFNSKMQPIDLPKYDVSDDDTPVVLTGWGKLQAHGEVPESLQKIDLKIISKKKCDQFWDEIIPVSDSHICTFTKRGEGSCNGDSGSPLVAGNVQVGIVSYGFPCARGYPDVFTKVYKYIDWIQEQQDAFSEIIRS